MIYCAINFVNLCVFPLCIFVQQLFNHTEILGESLSYTKKYTEICVKLCPLRFFFARFAVKKSVKLKY